MKMNKRSLEALAYGYADDDEDSDSVRCVEKVGGKNVPKFRPKAEDMRQIKPKKMKQIDKRQYADQAF